jgi:hypothetical protein
MLHRLYGSFGFRSLLVCCPKQGQREAVQVARKRNDLRAAESTTPRIQRLPAVFSSACKPRTSPPLSVALAFTSTPTSRPASSSRTRSTSWPAAVRQNLPEQLIPAEPGGFS